MFALSALVIIGFVGFATEAGVWYAVRRTAQGAADAAAIAGALAANPTNTSGTNPVTAAEAVAGENGFTDGAATTVGRVSVAAYSPPGGDSNYTGNYGSTIGAVEATVSEAMTPLISRLFGGTGIIVGARSVAVVEQVGQACALTLTGDLTVSGTIGAGSCGLASNANDATAIDVSGALTAFAATAVGAIGGTGTITLSNPAAPYHPPTLNPFATAPAAASLPTFPPPCTPLPKPDPQGNVGNPTPLPPYDATANPVAYCDPNIDGSTQIAGITLISLTLQPGTYFFYNGFTLTDGALQCPTCSISAGVSIVVLGTSNTTLNIGPNAVLSSVFAAVNNLTYPTLNGILFYGPTESTATVGLVAQTLPPNDFVSGFIGMIGAFYFPNANLTFNAAYSTNCLLLVAAQMNLTGTFSLAPSQCGNSWLAQMQGARLVQ
jgi:hypothetical protein